jgi:hypothetical protein
MHSADISESPTEDELLPANIMRQVSKTRSIMVLLFHKMPLVCFKCLIHAHQLCLKLLKNSICEFGRLRALWNRNNTIVQ